MNPNSNTKLMGNGVLLVAIESTAELKSVHRYLVYLIFDATDSSAYLYDYTVV